MNEDEMYKLQQEDQIIKDRFRCPSCGSFDTTEDVMVEEEKSYHVHVCNKCSWWG